MLFVSSFSAQIRALTEKSSTTTTTERARRRAEIRRLRDTKRFSGKNPKPQLSLELVIRQRYYSLCCLCCYLENEKTILEGFKTRCFFWGFRISIPILVTFGMEIDVFSPVKPVEIWVSFIFKVSFIF